MTYPDNFYRMEITKVVLTRGQSDFMGSPSRAGQPLDTRKLLEGKPAFSESSSETVGHSKVIKEQALVIASSNAADWEVEKVKSVCEVIKQLIADEFPVYLREADEVRYLVADNVGCLEHPEFRDSIVVKQQQDLAQAVNSGME